MWASDNLSGEDVPVHFSAGIANGGALSSESFLRLLRREHNETGCNSGAMVGIASPNEIDKQVAGCYDLVPSLLSPVILRMARDR